MGLEYLLVDLLILAFPLIMTFRWRFSYARFFPALWPAIALVGGAFIAWDVYATATGAWSFESERLSGPSAAGLPIEEILFFIVVPYSCIFIYENLEHFLGDSRARFPRVWALAACAVFLVMLGLFFRNEYTAAAMAACAAFFAVCLAVRPSMLESRNFWAYVAISMVPFIIFNFVLTSVPIVTYDPGAIWGGDGWWNGRFLTIPLEDFFYNFAMLAFYLLAYLQFKDIAARRKWI